MNWGFVYVLDNISMPGIYKVGYTERSPSRRAYELSVSTATPRPFRLICYAEYEEARAREQEIHAALSKYRVSPNREFFQCDLLLITDLVMSGDFAISRCFHEMDPTLYSDSQLFHERLAQSKVKPIRPASGM